MQVSHLELQHQAHKARLARFANAAYSPKPVPMADRATIDVAEPERTEPAPAGTLWFWIIDDPVDVRAIQRAAGKYFDVRKVDLLGQTRSKYPVRARQVAMYVCKTLLGTSLPQMGRKFGDRDHTTCLHAIRKVERILPLDAEIACAVATIIAELDPEHRG